MKLVYSLIFVLMATNGFADDLKTIEHTRNLSDRLINHFIKAEFKQGLDMAKPHWPLPEVEIDGLANKIATQWPIVDQRFGKPTGTEFLSEERIGASFVRYSYLHKFENHAIYWRITFYKPVDAWKINAIQFFDTIEPLFERMKNKDGAKPADRAQGISL